MYKHIMEKHEGNIRNEFKIKRHRIDKDPIRRIIRESVRIERAVKDNSIIVMNSKDEHFGVQTVRGSFNSEWFEDQEEEFFLLHVGVGVGWDLINISFNYNN